MKDLQVPYTSEEDVTALPLSDIIDAPAVQSMMEDLYRLTNIGCALVDLRGNVLVTVGWQDICTKFHRIHPETLKNCQKSDIELSTGVPFGQYKAYRCENNLWDVSTPIVMNNKHVGNIFLGQFFYEDEEIDKDFFRKQALRYNFNEEEYLSALERVPRYRRETVDAAMSLYAKLAGMISTLSYNNFQQYRMLQERKRAEDALRESEERFHELFERTPLGYQSLDSEGRFLEVNFAWLELLGYKREEVIGKWFGDFLAPEYIRAFRERFQVFKAQGEVYSEFYMMHKDGSRRYIAFDGRIGHNADGSFKQTHCILKDETERKRADNLLRESEEKHHRLFETISQGVIYHAADGTIISANPAAERILGLSSDQMQGQTSMEPCWKMIKEDGSTVSGSDHPTMVALRTGETVGPVIRGVFHPEKNNHIWLNITAIPLFQPGETKPFQAYATFEDVTDRKRAEEELRESKAILQAAMNQSQAGIAIADAPTGLLRYVNDAGLLIRGETREAVVNGIGVNEYVSRWKILDLDGTPLPSDQVPLSRAILYGETSSREFIIRRSEYDDRIVWANAAPIRNEQGQVIAGIVVFHDITDRKRAEEELRRKEYDLRESQRIAHIGSWRLDVATNQVVWTEELYNMYGFDPSLPPPPYTEHMKLFTPESWERLSTALLHTRETGIPYTLELETVRKDGSHGWMWVQGEADVDSSGKTVELRGAAQDITERKRAEEALRKSEALYRSLVETLPQCILRKDVEGRFTFIDSNFCCSVNRAPEEILGKTDFDFYSKELAEKYRADDVYVIENNVTFECVEENALPNGEKRFVQVLKTPLHDTSGKVTGIQCIFSDITKHKKAEEALRESEARFKALHNASFGGITIHDKGIILDCNKGLSDISGYSIEELIGMDGLLLIAEQSRKMVMANILAGYEKPYEAMGLRKNGEEYPLRLEARNVPYKGKMVRTVEFRDITDQKRVETEKEKLLVQLAQAQKMESVGRLAGGVAHDFNNMLGVILGQTEMALEDEDPATPLYAGLQTIQQAAKRSAALTQQLLAFARKQTVLPKVLNLNETVASMLKMLQRLIGEDIDLAWKPGGALWLIKMDPAQIDQILANLCVNARDAIADVGKITIETNNVTFDKAYCARHAGFIEGDFVLLAVSDDGCGMDNETLSHLFEPFFTTKEMGKGTGLGLASIYGAVKQNNGFINVYSEPGHGTRFTVYIPRYTVGTVQEKEERNPQAETHGNETILLVEDEPSILKMISMMLKRLGYTVIAAPSPSEAIHLAKEYSSNIDLLMTDVVMPGMNGRDLAKTILPIFPDIRLLFMSGYTANVIAHHSVLEEDVHFIQKPFSMSDLGIKIREALGNEE